MTTQLELFNPPQKPKNPTGAQHKAILNHLRQGFSLTVVEALDKFGVYALSQRAGDLRRMGWPIKDRWRELPNGKRIKEYFL